ncbi:bifunctional metallophosphatase/5'-nucleotidase [Virgibacillus massiliensis]|nr:MULTISPECIES: bifunctional UDP-sugar hydrolase/5'-nucleotidase [Virgibacillus]MYL43845.1 bifunctional metallophosphatase/5'-nucleotidase [Virgibacillus massiliensis]
MLFKLINLTILYTSDIHGHIMPINYATNEKTDSGLAKYATVVKQKRKESDYMIVVDNGDLIQGTPLMTHYVKEHMNKLNPMIQAMNTIGIDAGVIGNHEFNYGMNVLHAAIDQSHYPWLAANIIDKESNQPKFGPPYLTKIFENGLKIAIIGVTTHYIPNWESPDHLQGINFEDASSTLQKWVSHIQMVEQPDVLIAAYHGGFEKDLQTGEPTETLTGENQAYEMCDLEGIDILLTGHQHRKIIGDRHGTLFIQPGHNAVTYGEIQVTLEQDETNHWNIINKQASIGRLETMDTDKKIVEDASYLEASTQKWLDQPIGNIIGDMTIRNPFEARINKHPFIEFIQKVQMRASGANISVTALLNNHATGFSSTVTMRNVVSNYMYPNTLVVLELSGKDIKEALEQTATYFKLAVDGRIIVNPAYEDPKPQHYNYDMWEGIEYTINVANPVGNRIEKLSYQKQPIKNTATYSVVMNNYRASGGGNYAMFKGKSVIKEIQKDTVELIREYFDTYTTIEATVTNNYKVIAK